MAGKIEPSLRIGAARRKNDAPIDHTGLARYAAVMPSHDPPGHFAPGDLVRHPERPEWGLGRVQTALGGRLTATFENAGKQSINALAVALLRVEPPRQAE
jgi:hypothetical protein